MTIPQSDTADHQYAAPVHQLDFKSGDDQEIVAPGAIDEAVHSRLVGLHIFNEIH